MEQQFQYYAFISYKREDEKWAKWLQNKLESYKLPSVIRKELPRLPKRIRPIFRDKTDLGAGILAESLRGELEMSQYLIVICSPHAAQAEWVGKEISEFTAMGRADRIIPFIVDGEPNSKNPKTECFNPVLKQSIPELLGINIHEISKDQAFIKVVAKLLNLRFDTLWNRHSRLQKRRRIMAICASIVLLMGLVFMWDYNRVTYEYYADYVDRWGVPEGVLKLDKEEVGVRNHSYRFEYERIPFGEPNAFDWRLAKVLYINSAGRPQ